MLVAGSSPQGSDRTRGRPRTSQRTSMKKTLMKDAFEAACERCGGDQECCGSIGSITVKVVFVFNTRTNCIVTPGTHLGPPRGGRQRA